VKRLFALLTAAATIAGCGGSDSIDQLLGPTADPNSFRLTVLHANNADSALLNAGPGLEDFGGADRFATLAQQLGSGQPAVLTLSSGDSFGASSQFETSLDRGVPYYDSLALDLIGFDASAIGNQEFDYGPDVLAEFLVGFSRQIPFLSANLDVSGESALSALQAQGRIARSAVLVRQGRSVGLVGVTTPRVSFIASPRDVVVDPSVAPAVQQEIDSLREQGVNIIILLSHLETQAENQSLLADLDGVDLVVAATPEEILASPGTPLVPGDEALVVGDYPTYYSDAAQFDIPVVTTGGRYKYVGRFTGVFDQAGNLTSVEQAGPVRVAGGGQPDAVAPDPRVVEQVTEPVALALAQRAATIVATTEVALDATAENLLQRETNLGDLVADALLARGTALAPQFGAPLPDIALVNGGGIASNQVYPAGNLSVLDLENLLPFVSFLSIVENIPPSQLKELLENSVSKVETNDGRFAQVAGLEFTWDPNGIAQQVDDDGTVLVAGSRVREVVLDGGTPVVTNGLIAPGAPTVNIATLDFTARGGDQYPYRGAAFTSLGITYATALEDFLQQNLGGVVQLISYPAGGQGRITRL
jgi:5'-nucleotidase